MAQTPVLWLCGPSGVGKTTVAWEIYSRLADAGARVGYVDIDQLGMCYPAPASDPGRHRLQADNLHAVVAGYRAAGARCVVVSGVVDPVHGVDAGRIPNAALVLCRLRADGDELARRLVGRHGDAEWVAQALAEAEALDASDPGGRCVDTSGRGPAEVVRLVQERTAGWTEASRPTGEVPPAPVDTTDGPILLLCGATGVGKSTAGFDLYQRHVLRRQIPGAFVDLDQIGFYRRGPAETGVDHPTRARILAGLWRNFRTAGARCLTVVGPVEDRTALSTYAEALPEATITVCRLHAGPDELLRRIVRRGQGGGWAQPGDPLKGRPAAYLSSVAERATADAEALDRAAVGDLRIDTDGRTVAQVADAIVAATGWPPSRRTTRPTTSSSVR
jgi:broad-specificity NMP kinase